MPPSSPRRGTLVLGSLLLVQHPDHVLWLSLPLMRPCNPSTPPTSFSRRTAVVVTHCAYQGLCLLVAPRATVTCLFPLYHWLSLLCLGRICPPTCSALFLTEAPKRIDPDRLSSVWHVIGILGLLNHDRTQLVSLIQANSSHVPSNCLSMLCFSATSVITFIFPG